MKEHAKLLELYAMMFEETQKKISTSNEFNSTMQSGGKFS